MNKHKPWRKALAGLAFLICVTATAEVVVHRDGGALTVTADDHRLDDILREIAIQYPLRVESGVELSEKRDLEIVNRDVVFVLRRLLRQQNHMIVRDRYGAIYVYVFADGGPERPVIAAIDAGEGDAPTWDATVSLLLDESANTRIDALDALVEIDNVAAIPLLGSALADPDEDVRAAAIGLLGDAGAVGTLQRDWTSRPATEQVQIVDELGDIESPQATAFLRRVAASGDQALASIARAYLDERK